MSPESARPAEDERYEVPVEEALELARGHHVAGNFFLAERTYRDIIRAIPDHPTANHLLGTMYYQLGNFERALDYMEKSIQAEPGEKKYWLNYGGVMALAGKYEEAIACFDEVLKTDPDNTEALNRKSYCYWQLNRNNEAEETARRALALAPHNLDGYVNLGISLAQQDRYKESAAVWEEASEHHPDDVRIWSNWSNMSRELGQNKKAAKLAEKALEINPRDTDALNNLGCALRKMGQTEEAIETFRKATNIKPKFYLAHYNLALTLYDEARYEEASIAARYAIDFNENYGEAYSILSSSLVELGEFGQAHFAAQNAIHLDPDKADPYLDLADVLYLSSRFDDGHAALQEALNRDPDNPQCYARLANVYERLDDVENALQAIDKSIELAPDMPVYIARKAAILHVAGRIEEALACVDEALAAAPRMLMAMAKCREEEELRPRDSTLSSSLSISWKSSSSTDLNFFRLERVK